MKSSEACCRCCAFPLMKQKSPPTPATGEWKDVRSSSPARTRKLQLAAEQPLTGERRIPSREGAPHPRAKEKPQQDGGRGKLRFRIKPHTCQRLSEGSNRPRAHQDPETPRGWARAVSGCAPWRCGSARDCCGAGARGAADLGVAQAPLEEDAVNPHRAARTYTGLGDRLWEGTSKTLWAPGPGERSSGHRRDWAALAVSAQGSPEQVWGGGPLQTGDTGCSSACCGLWRRSPLSPSPPPHRGLRSNSREGTRPHPPTEN